MASAAHLKPVPLPEPALRIGVLAMEGGLLSSLAAAGDRFLEKSDGGVVSALLSCYFLERIGRFSDSRVKPIHEVAEARAAGGI